MFDYRTEMKSVGMSLPEPQRRKVLVLNTGGRVGMVTNPKFSAFSRSGFGIGGGKHHEGFGVVISTTDISATSASGDTTSGGAGETTGTQHSDESSVLVVTAPEGTNDNIEGGLTGWEERIKPADHVTPDEMREARLKIADQPTFGEHSQSSNAPLPLTLSASEIEGLLRKEEEEEVQRLRAPSPAAHNNISSLQKKRDKDAAILDESVKSKSTTVNNVAKTATAARAQKNKGKHYAANQFIAKAGYLQSQMRTMTDFKDRAMPHFSVLDVRSGGQTGERSPSRSDQNDYREDDDVKHSAEVTPQDWIVLAEAILENYLDYDGFVVVHGTDTMHYSATALSFMFVNLGKPIIFTGAMLPLEEAYNDARRNLCSAMMFAAHTDVCEVCVYFNDTLLRGNRAVMASQTMSAFESPNFPPLAIFSHDGFTVNSGILRKQPGKAVELRRELSRRVICVVYTCELDAERLCDTLFPLPLKKVKESSSGTITTKPSSAASLTNFARCDALIVEVSGIGEAADSYLARTLRKLADRAALCDAFVGITSPSLVHGTPEWQQRRYIEVSPLLVQLDDMTTEAAVVKAMYLCGHRRQQFRTTAASSSSYQQRTWTMDDIRRLMVTNIRGEISPNSRVHYYNQGGSKL